MLELASAPGGSKLVYSNYQYHACRHLYAPDRVLDLEAESWIMSCKCSWMCMSHGMWIEIFDFSRFHPTIHGHGHETRDVMPFGFAPRPDRPEWRVRTCGD